MRTKNNTNLQRHDILFWGDLDKPKKKQKISKEEIMLYVEIAIITMTFTLLFLNY